MMRVTAAVDLRLLSPEAVERPGPGLAPTAFRIWRAGENPTDKGQTVFSEKSAAVLIDDQGLRKNLYSIDVDHLSLSDQAPPEARKAVGFHRLEVRRDSSKKPELWAVDVEWTDVVRAGLEKSPPEWRYFSPAYDVDKKTREVTAYLNTALTNNPATWGVTALATSTTEEKVMTKKDMIAALQHMAKGESPEAKVCGAVVAMLESGKVPEEDKDLAPGDCPVCDGTGKKDGEECPTCHGTGKKKQPDAEDPPPKKMDGDPLKTDAVTAVAETPMLALAAKVQSLEAKLAERDEKEERARLLASRPDFAPEVVAALGKESLETLRFAVKTFEKRPMRTAAVTTTTAPTRGETQGDPSDGPRGDYTLAQLDEQMGITPRMDGIKNDGTRLTLGVMTPDQARAVMASRAKGGK